MSHSFSDIQKTIKRGLARFHDWTDDDNELRIVFRNMQAVLEVEAQLLSFSNHVRCLEDVMAYVYRLQSISKLSWTMSSNQSLRLSNSLSRNRSGEHYITSYGIFIYSVASLSLAMQFFISFPSSSKYWMW